MLFEEYERALKKRRSDLEADAYNKSHKDLGDYRESKGVWLGLGEALGILADLKKKERNDD